MIANNWQLRTEFDEFIGGLGLVNFSPEELLVNTGQPGNAPPSSVLWNHIVPTILVLQKLRTFFNKPITLLSVYRYPPYNKTIEGASQTSQHQAFSAIDFRVDGAKPLHVENHLKAWRGRWFQSPVDMELFHRTALVIEGVYDEVVEIPFEPLRTMDNRFRWDGGVKGYDTFIHIDSRGVSANW